MTRPAERDLIRVINYLWCMEDFDQAAKEGRFRQIGGRPKSIDPAEALIAPHSQSRLDECRRKMLAGQRMPAIHCERIVVGPHTFYNVSDGHHRVAIARELAKPTVPALIASQTVVDASRLVWSETPAPGLWWRRDNATLVLVVWLDGLTQSEREALAWLVAEATKLPDWRPLLDVWETWPFGAGFDIEGLTAYTFRKVAPGEADRFDRSGTWLGRITITRSDSHQELWGRRTWKDEVESD